MTLDARKRALRRELSERRRATAPERWLEAGRLVAASVVALPECRRAGRVALYAALPDELPTRPLFGLLRQAGRPVLLPRIVGERLEFAPIERWEELRPGRYGVPEPPAGRAAIGLEAGDLVVLPGVAFDAAGHRLGRGGGIYDRTFARGTPAGPVLCGVALELQVVDEVPQGPGDRAVDLVVTERTVRRMGEARRGA